MTNPSVIGTRSSLSPKIENGDKIKIGGAMGIESGITKEIRSGLVWSNNPRHESIDPPDLLLNRPHSPRCPQSNDFDFGMADEQLLQRFHLEIVEIPTTILTLTVTFFERDEAHSIWRQCSDQSEQHTIKLMAENVQQRGAGPNPVELGSERHVLQSHNADRLLQ